MKTIRLLFNDDMARAIVQGRKTVTRRPVTPNASQRWWLKIASQITACPSARMLGPAWPSTAAFEHPGGGPFTCIDAPCAPGDLLIGRECWGSGDLYYHDHETEPPGVIVYRADRSGRYADDTPLPKRDTDSFNWSMQKWRPSIHMPDWAARIRRRVVSVTVVRLQDITEDDAVREGFSVGEEYEVFGASTRFCAVWNSAYAEKGLGWDANPWVWRIEFSAERD